MSIEFKDCFLHFLDRELLETQGAYNRVIEESISRDVRFILLNSPGDLILSASFLFESKYAYAIFEERRSGVSMSNVIKFLNGKFIGLNMQENTNDNRQIEEGIIPSEDFFTLINKSERIMAAELIVDKALLGSGFMNMIDCNNDKGETEGGITKKNF